MPLSSVRSGIIWDLDHTLYESHVDMHDEWTNAFHYAALRQGFTHSRAEVAEFVREKHKIYGNTIRFYSSELGADEKRLYDDIMAMVRVPDLPECAKTQAALRSLPIDAMVILTSANRRWADMILERIGLLSLFADGRIVSMDETEGLLKSQSPVPFEMAAKITGQPVSALVMVDDTAVNLKIAKELGMATVLVTHGVVPEVPTHVDFVVNKAYDVITLINEGAISWASASHS